MILGLDPGQRRDPAGLAIVDRLAVVHLARLPLGTSYTQVADHAADLARGCEALVVDVGGVGRAVLDLLADRVPRSKLVAVTLTGGQRVHVRDGDPREMSLPRSALFQPLQAAVEARRLRVAEGLTYGPALAGELLQARGGASGAESRGAGHHGDLMTAVALCLWWQGLARLA